MSDANVVKFSNDGRLMLLTTTDGHIHVLDSFRGTLVSYFLHNLTPFALNQLISVAQCSLSNMVLLSLLFSYPRTM